MEMLLSKKRVGTTEIGAGSIGGFERFEILEADQQEQGYKANDILLYGFDGEVWFCVRPVKRGLKYETDACRSKDYIFIQGYDENFPTFQDLVKKA